MHSALRLFLAIEPELEVRSALADLSAQLRKKSWGNYLRWIHPENLHITLHFIGICSPERIETLTEQIKIATTKIMPFELQFGPLRLFPTPSHPRVLIVSVLPDAPLFNLFDCLGQAILAAGFTPEQRAYIPHLSLGRLLQIKKLSEVKQNIQIAPNKFIVKDIALMHSELIDNKRIYTVLQRFPLNTVIKH